MDVRSKLGHNLVTTWSLIGLRQNMAILWTFIGQNMDFGQKLARTWETHIRYQHRELNFTVAAVIIAMAIAEGTAIVMATADNLCVTGGSGAFPGPGSSTTMAMGFIAMGI